MGSGDGEGDRFRAVYAEHYPAVLRYARRRVPEQLAPDTAAEVFLVAWRRVRELPREPLPWLYGVARKVVANQLRTVARSDRLTERVAFAAGIGRVEQAGSRCDDPAALVLSRAGLVEAFGRLGPDDREVLGLVAWEGLGARELAAALSCSIPAVTMRLHRARRRLAAELTGLGTED